MMFALANMFSYTYVFRVFLGKGESLELRTYFAQIYVNSQNVLRFVSLIHVKVRHTLK